MLVPRLLRLLRLRARVVPRRGRLVSVGCGVGLLVVDRGIPVDVECLVQGVRGLRYLRAGFGRRWWLGGAAVGGVDELARCLGGPLLRCSCGRLRSSYDVLGSSASDWEGLPVGLVVQ